MALIDCTATALTTHGAHPYGLFVGGLDVLEEPVAAPRYAVPVDSISIVEAGPGGVSSLTFTIEDSALVIVLDPTSEVVYWDFVRDVPMFGGWIDSISVEPSLGQQGRAITVQCSGYETYLDTIAVGDGMLINFATAAGMDIGQTIQETVMLQLLAGFTPLRANSDTTLGRNANQASPVAGRATVAPRAVTVDFRGMSVRQAFAAYLAATVTALGYSGTFGSASEAGMNVADVASLFLTVDFYKGVRFQWYQGWTGISKWFNDYATLTITDTPGGTTAASGVKYALDSSPGAIVNGTFIVGGNAAGTGYVGTGLSPRREVGVTDSTIVDNVGRTGSAVTAMRDKIGPAGRGNFHLSTFTPIVGIHPGSPLTITDARAGISGSNWVITEIRKTMNSGGTQEWDIDFAPISTTPGGAGGSASVTRKLRSLTRGTN